jgi:cephalosporin hydroxylase
MAMKMDSYIFQLKNLLWKGRYKFKGVPWYRDFQVAATREMAETAESKFGGLFFEHDGDVVNKWVHCLPIYDALILPYAGSDVRMLEIGVSKGGSLALWRKALGGRATIFGIDIDPKCADFDGRFATVRIGSQDDAGFLKDVVREMGGVDIVLDDGSHVASHQRASFETLFPLLSEGGLYIIEDVHTAYWPSFEGGLKRSGTAIEFMKKQIDEMHSHYLNKARNTETAIPPIESIQFFDSVVAVRKRKQAPRGHVNVPQSVPKTTLAS